MQLCLVLAQQKLKRARIILENIGTEVSHSNGDVTNLNRLRNCLENQFHNYLEERSADSRKQFVAVIDEIEELQSTTEHYVVKVIDL